MELKSEIWHKTAALANWTLSAAAVVDGFEIFLPIPFDTPCCSSSTMVFSDAARSLPEPQFPYAAGKITSKIILAIPTT
jgi:hypothetical protein